MKTGFIAITLLLALAACGSNAGDAENEAGQAMAEDNSMFEDVQIVNNESSRQIDVTVDGQPFTSWCYWEKLKKPVLYPLRADDGRVVTRSYPEKFVPGERVDHPHQLSCWFNYGDVNGDDFWGNSDSVDQTKGHFGTIVQRSVDNVTSGKGEGHIEVSMDWVGSAGKPLLKEHDLVYFRARPGLRIIDRVMTLTAQDQKVVFNDTKEGAFGIRVTRSLEEPSTEPLKYVDERGEVTEVAKLDNTGVKGSYLSSEGKVDEKEVWASRAKWCILRGPVDNKEVTIGIFDHPKNVGYPTYWHARGYGLFAANPFGWKTFTNGAEELQFTLAPGESTTIRYRILIASSSLDKEATDKLYDTWLKEIGE